MSQQYSQDEVLEVVRKEIAASSLRKVAARLGIGAPYLSDIMRGNRQVSDAVADLFGFEREVVTTVTFRRKK